MISLLLAKYKGILLAGALVGVGAAAFTGGWKLRDLSAAAQLSDYKAEQARKDAQQLTAHAAVVEGLVAEKARQQEQIDDAQKRYVAAAQLYTSYVLDGNRAAQRLRADITAYASDRGTYESLQAALEACSARARSLGGVLGEALQTSETCAGSGEVDRAAARLLWDAWPSAPQPAVTAP